MAPPRAAAAAASMSCARGAVTPAIIRGTPRRASSAPKASTPALDADPLVQPILLVQSFYRMVNQLSVARGRDPDRPPTLAKVTETV